MIALLTVSEPVLLGLALAAISARVAISLARWHRARAAGDSRLRADVPGETVLLGSDSAGGRVRLGPLELSAHGLILGASGAGKSTTLLTILTEYIRTGRPVVAIDLKGSPAFARELDQAARASGRRLRIWTLDGSEHWNPLAVGNATELKDKLIATERFTEPHYQRSAERYLQIALQVMIDADPGRPVTLARVVAMLDPGRLAGALRGLEPVRAESARDYLASLTPDQHSAIRGLASRLAIITESHTGAYLEPAPGGTIDLRTALAGREIVLFKLNSSVYGKLAAQLGTLAVQDLVTAAGHRLSGGFGEQAIVGIDEFSALGSDNVISLLARGREAGVSVLLATQELADLDRAARGLRDQVLGNTAVKIAHRQEVPESAAAIARMAGTVKDWERTYHVGGGRRRSTVRPIERPVVEPDAIRSLRTGEAVVITKLPSAQTRLTRILPPRRDGPER
jgi:conjugal transfer pilus assembly protein TraD